MNFLESRTTPQERARTEDLLRVVPKNRKTILDIGARDGYFSTLLTAHFETVTALDLSKPSLAFDRVIPVQGDVRALDYPDDSFDVVFCAEVLEHIPRVETACREISRVARHEVVIGVPYRQDTRVGRLTCRDCGRECPPWGHLNTFDEKGLRSLFAGLAVLSISFAGETREKTNRVSTVLMDLAGNPWGTYGQEEPCPACGNRMMEPPKTNPLRRACSAVAHRLNGLQAAFSRPRPNWIHGVFQKRP